MYCIEFTNAELDLVVLALVSKHSPPKRTLEAREAEVPDANFSFSPSSDFFHEEAFKINCCLYCASQCLLGLSVLLA